MLPRSHCMAGTHTRVDAPNLSSPFTLIGDTKPGIFIFYSCVYMVAFPKMLQDPRRRPQLVFVALPQAETMRSPLGLAEERSCWGHWGRELGVGMGAKGRMGAAQAWRKA